MVLRLSRIAILAVVIMPPDARCEVKDYEIARFVLHKTSCGMLELTRSNPGRHPPRFHADCNNVAGWPEGMDIECAIHDDDRSCRVMTRERVFKYLDLLRQKD